MIRRRQLQRLISGFALLAMLAVALTPTLGRLFHPERSLVAATVSDAAVAGGAICTTTGLAYRDSVAAVEREWFALDTPARPPGPAPAPMSHDGADCTYCVLTAVTLPPAVVRLIAFPPPNTAFLIDAAATYTVAWRYPSGLGSRGPPV